MEVGVAVGVGVDVGVGVGVGVRMVMEPSVGVVPMSIPPVSAKETTLTCRGLTSPGEPIAWKVRFASSRSPETPVALRATRRMVFGPKVLLQEARSKMPPGPAAQVVIESFVGS